MNEFSQKLSMGFNSGDLKFRDIGISDKGNFIEVIKGLFSLQKQNQLVFDFESKD